MPSPQATPAEIPYFNSAHAVPRRHSENWQTAKEPVYPPTPDLHYKQTKKTDKQPALLRTLHTIQLIKRLHLMMMSQI